ncbi:hypothetical protein SCLCIDRAFT_31303 [Scleroderma citrinum Foug A]|uniref:Uncharacterized protein n=1 Tax=Scleroderma citrinum Foug A TaxID=1036808 RepID=A0A0C3DDP2_9AGAM|nr:hypothetical protein SCLCIDRAFT_31303 [Scleroderma citrinum Foug A]
MSVTPSASSRYASPAPPTPSTTTATATPKPVLSKQKAVNVFSNDGSFLERFQRPKKEDEEKRKAEEALTRKRQFADRFKTRGKRHLPPPDTSPAVTTIDAEEGPAKKPKLDEAPPPLINYQKEVRNQQGWILKDTGTGFRPLAK